jgi:hypothetical protein
MSSKQQFRETLKREKQTLSSLNKDINELKEKLALREKIIDEQRLQIKLLQIELKRKRQWYQFWK